MSFNDALQFTLGAEGGFSNNANDHGGATNYGISTPAFNAAKDQGIIPQDMDINDLTPEELSKAIRKALSDQEMGIKARERIIRNFSLEKRRRKLLAVLEELTSSISKATK